MTTVFALQLVAWILAPLVAFGVDETVDPTRFALLPIRPQTLQRGLLVTSLIGLLPLLNMVLLVGAAIGIGVPWSVLPVAVLCAAVQLVICVVLSRAASTSMSALMTSRRGRDLGMGVGFLIFLLYFAFITFINNPGGTSGNALESGVRSSAGFLTWSPPGALANLPGLLASGEYGKAGLAALIALAALGAGVVVVVECTSQEPDHGLLDDREFVARPGAGTKAVLLRSAPPAPCGWSPTGIGCWSGGIRCAGCPG